MTDTEIAYEEGGEARLDGQPFLACPYAEGKLMTFWQAGWMDADMQLRQPREQLQCG